MGEEVKQEKYQLETLSGNDPVAAFLALKSVTESDNRGTRLRKLGNIMGKAEADKWPYKGNSLQNLNHKKIFLLFE